MSALTDWLFDTTPGIEDAAPDLPEHLVKSGHLPTTDDDFAEPITDPIPLDEIYTVIDYRDAEGYESRRRITMRTIAPGRHAPILKAICHERRAFRAFRTDRIEGFIEDTGEVIECPVFFRDFVGVDLSHMVNLANPAEPALVEARRVRDTLRAPLSLLVALARADNRFVGEELEAICAWAAAETPHITRPDHPGDLPPLNELRNIIRRMRPSRESLPGYLGRIRDMAGKPENIDRGFRERFENALEAVVWADGRFVERERAILDDLGIATDDIGNGPVWR